MATNDVYLGNPNLKKAGTPIQFTKKQVQEWIDHSYQLVWDKLPRKIKN